jgi:hypothetical protein
MFRPPEKRTSPRMAPRARKKSKQFAELVTNEPDFTPSPNVVQLPVIVVDVEIDPGEHGYHVRARHCGRLTYHRKSFGVLSAARREADALAAARGWRVAL